MFPTVCVFRPGEAFVRVSVSKSSTAASVLTEVLSQLDRQVDPRSYSLENPGNVVEFMSL